MALALLAVIGRPPLRREVIRIVTNQGERLSR